MNLPGFTAAKAFAFSSGSMSYAAGNVVGMGRLSLSMQSTGVNQLVYCQTHADCGRRQCCFKQDFAPSVCRVGPCNP